MPFQRVLIANRGAVARRIVRTLHAGGSRAIAVFAAPDAAAPLLHDADEAWPLDGDDPRAAYLDQAQLIDIVRRSRADAVHPGYGFLAESAAFARAVRDAGAVFVGPPPELLELFADKVRTRAHLAAQGLPVAAGSGPLATLDAARAAAATLGWPLLLKPVGGGGGIGMARVEDEAALDTAFAAAQALSGRTFGSALLYLERAVPAPRHVEFQVLVDAGGAAMHLHDRDCTLQRRHQKVLEEAPAPALDPDRQADLAGRSAAALAGAGYCGLGTVEMLRGSDGSEAFLEVNPRLQVEHGVTEMVTGVDLVAVQLALAAGAPLARVLPTVPAPAGHAIEARVLAEHPRTFLPSPGRLEVFRPPRMPHVRIETGYAEGMTVTPWFDPLLAKVIAHGDTRARAIGRLLVALRAFAVAGIDSNLPLLRRVLESPEFLAVQIDTGTLGRL